MIDGMSTSKNTPKLSAPSLEMKNNYYIVPWGDTYNYYAIKIAEETLDSPIMRFEKSPPILLDGVVIVKKKIYEVTAADILRGIVRKSREIKKDKRDGSTSAESRRTTQPAPGPQSEDGKIPAVLREVAQSRNHGGSIQDPEMEVGEVADIAWEDQIGALLDLIHSKEGGEWEIEGPAQP